MKLPQLNTMLLEGDLRKSGDTWVLETHDRKLYRVDDLLQPFVGKEVRFIVVELADVQEIQTLLECHASTDEEREEES